MKIVSVIVPCYNHGIYLREAIDSVLNLGFEGIEIIIVNDGSTDEFTRKVLFEFESEENGIQVIHQTNSGLGRARNAGIEIATGKYILPLDADNKLLPNYFIKGVDILQNDPSISVVYGNLIYFGEKEQKKDIPDFNLQKLIIGNFIDACAIYRKSAWIEVNGYDEQMPFMGIEDWEFWLRLSFSGHKFYHLNEPCFYYRLINTSMINKDTGPNFQILRNYIEKKHKYFIDFEAPLEYFSIKMKANPIVFLFKLLLYTYFKKTYLNLVLRGKIRRF